ncbi:WD40-repeat-containing domain protein [Lasiosphaeris hirsuta]|uniref:Pre-mRNA-processing factor 19 n=1 Tax=Lasiosphaeris hirsuta TaxID=260670 RepID=A0AA39ZVC2_9PEZI|nr:WD40-repeat-containing domain protein [Lasiosphaeris hirsuta]
MASPTPVTLSFVTLDVFTTTRFLGNPLAVVLIPAALRGSVDRDTKQRIAAEFNLSETVFLHTLDTEPATDVTTREIDIFMSDKELPFAGHPTIGSANLVLHHLGWSHVDTLLTTAGPIAIRAEPGGGVRAAIPHAVHIHSKVLGDVITSAPADVVALVNDGLSRGDDEIRAAELSSPMANIVRGMTFMLVQLPSLEHLGRVSVKRIPFGRVVGLLDEGEGEGSDGFVSRYHYVVTGWSEAEDGSQHWEIRSRLLELPFEDPATGSAACTLASYLTVSKGAVSGATFSITQGVEMGRQSEITVRAVAALEGDKVKIKEVYMGGQAVVVMNGISGEIPEEPVVSRKTGTVFEKRLILKYIEENGKEPGTDEELHPEDLLDVKTSRVVRPRPPNFTSLPSLLKAFQNEWDALVLETYNTKEQLSRTREELATALYQHDAAVRVIARLTSERDEAREALSKVTVTQTGGDASDAMAIDNESLPADLVEHVDQLHSQLTKGRKKRPVPRGWATLDDVAALQQTAVADLTVTQATSLDLQSDFAAIGGLDGKVDIYSTQANKVERSLDIGEPVTATIWTDTKVILATSKGSVRVFDSGSETATFKAHAGAVTGLALHPGERILASVGADKSFVFYDIESLKQVSRVYTDAALTACAFHPDGHLFAAGTQSGDIKVFQTGSGEEAASFHLGPPIQALVFSENGFWFAATGKGQSTVTIFDLRKEGAAAQVKEIETGDAQSLAWDYTGQFLATAGSTGVTVQQYLKSSKAWSEPLRTSVPGVALRWGGDAKSLVTVNKEGVVSVLGLEDSE